MIFMHSNILGIDVGYDRCGYAVIELSTANIINSGVIKTDALLVFKNRLRKLRHKMIYIKSRFKPKAISMELLFFYRKNKIFEKICMAKGVITEVFADLDIYEIEPAKMKKFTTGYGKAKKKDMRLSLKKMVAIDLKSKCDDEIDAIALGLYLRNFLLNKDED